MFKHLRASLLLSEMCDNEPPASLSDFHDYEPNLEFDDTELSQAPPPQLLNFDVPFDDDSFQSGKRQIGFSHLLITRRVKVIFARKRSSDEVVWKKPWSRQQFLWCLMCVSVFSYGIVVRLDIDMIFFTPTDKIFFYQTKQYKKT